MTGLLPKLRPGVSKTILPILAGTMWMAVGVMLSVTALRWLIQYQGAAWPYAVAGLTAAILIHGYGFIRIVTGNIKRIYNLPDKVCMFSFFSWKSYLLIIIMVSMGIALRHSSLPKQYLAIVYMGIGVALFLSGMQYFRPPQKNREKEPDSNPASWPPL